MHIYIYGYVCIQSCMYVYMYTTWNNYLFNPRLNFTSGVVIHHFVVMKFIHDVSLYKMIVPDLVRVTENDKTILLQNADWFLSSSYSKGTVCHYKMTTGFYHQITWRYLRGIPSHYKMTIGIHWFLNVFNMLLSHHPVLSGGGVVPSKRFTKPSINPYVVANLSLQKGFPGWIV